jgi:hypothetical protein
MTPQEIEAEYRQRASELESRARAGGLDAASVDLLLQTRDRVRQLDAAAAAQAPPGIDQNAWNRLRQATAGRARPIGAEEARAANVLLKPVQPFMGMKGRTGR